MNQFKTTSLADQVFEKLENDIIQGVYPRGEILTELKLVDQQYEDGRQTVMTERELKEKIRQLAPDFAERG